MYHLKDRYEIKILFGKKEADEIAPLFLLDQYPGLEMFEVSSLKRSLNPLSDLKAFSHVYRYIRSFRPHIVHTHGAKSGLLGRLAAFFNRVPVIVHTFHGHVFHSYFNRLITNGVLYTERLLASITTASIALSTSQKQEIVAKFSVFPAHKVHVIPLGLEVHSPAETSRLAFRNQYGLSASDIAIGIIGRIVPIKNHLDFLKIANKILHGSNKNTFFFIIGDGNLSAGLYHYLNERGVTFSTPGSKNKDSKVIFTSWLSDMPEVMAGLDIVALTSLNEGTPVSLIEAQYGAKPVIAYDVGGVKDTFIDSASGFLVKKGNINEFSDKLLLLIGDETLRIQMGEKGRLYCSQKFSKQSEVKATDTLYQSLLAKNELATL